MEIITRWHTVTANNNNNKNTEIKITDILNQQITTQRVWSLIYADCFILNINNIVFSPERGTFRYGDCGSWGIFHLFLPCAHHARNARAAKQTCTTSDPTDDARLLELWKIKKPFKFIVDFIVWYRQVFSFFFYLLINAAKNRVHENSF